MQPPLDGYRRLAEVARRQSALVEAGRFEELAAVAAEWDALVARLPEQAPAAARPLLEESSRLVASASATLAAGLADTRRQLGQLGQGRRAVAGYAAGAPAATGGGLVDSRG
jgi:hypothetical protein